MIRCKLKVKCFENPALRLYLPLATSKRTMDEKEKRDKHKSYNDRFVRWQQLTIGQISFTNNLFLGLNLGFLGFLVTQSGLTSSNICWVSIVQVLTLLGLGISFITGIILVINRLKDFRKTTQLVKKRKEKFEIEHNLRTSDNLDSVKSTIANLKTETYKLGKTTWTLLSCQIWTFMAGTILGLIYILIVKNASG